jgi:NAD(P)-dependent dehydrogenase (short-subunit alcohol dehydrogenase family)
VKMNNPLVATLAALGQRVGRAGAARSLAAEQRLDGRTWLVTGASSGLGKAIALDAARRGARVILACRSGIPAIGEEIARMAGSAQVEMLPVDFADLTTVEQLCDTLRDRGERIDVLVQNAGAMPRRDRRTVQGFEEMFQVNFLAGALLARRLLEDGVIPNRALARAAAIGRTGPAPRIVFVASEAHRSAPPIDADTLGDYVQYGTLTGMSQYAHTKLAVCTYANALARRLRSDDGVDVAVHAMCPGPVASKMAREAPFWIKPLLGPAMRLFFAPPDQAALPALYLAASPDIEGQTGLYLHRSALVEPAPSAREAERGDRVWQAVAALTQRGHDGAGSAP